MGKFDYKSRFFESYVSTHVDFVESVSHKSFDIVAQGLQKNISRFLPKDKSASILDVACGEGHFLHFLQCKGYNRAKGIDLGDEQLKVARKLGVKNIKKGNLFENLKEYQSYFDLIGAFNIIEHFTKDEAVASLDLMHNALKPGGTLLVITPNILSLGGLWRTFGDFTHEIVFNPRNLSQLLRVCKFTNVEIYGFSPVAYDLRSRVRSICWKALKAILRFCFVIEYGTGRSIWKPKPIFEGQILGVGRKIM